MNIRRFQFSSVSTSAADMSARILGEKNDMTRSLRPSEPKSLSRARARLYYDDVYSLPGLKASRARGPDQNRTPMTRTSPLPGTPPP